MHQAPRKSHRNHQAITDGCPEVRPNFIRLELGIRSAPRDHASENQVRTTTWVVFALGVCREASDLMDCSGLLFVSSYCSSSGALPCGSDRRGF